MYSRTSSRLIRLVLRYLIGFSVMWPVGSLWGVSNRCLTDVESPLGDCFPHCCNFSSLVSPGMRIERPLPIKEESWITDLCRRLSGDVKLLLSRLLRLSLLTLPDKSLVSAISAFGAKKLTVAGIDLMSETRPDLSTLLPMHLRERFVIKTSPEACLYFSL